MLVIDLILGALIVAAIAYGRVVGVGRALPTAGFAAGVVLGSRLPPLVGEELDSDFALVIALPAALIVGALLAALAERRAPRAARRVHRRPALDAGAGALLGGASAAVIVWALAPPVSEISTVRDFIQRSEVLDRMNAVLEPAGAVRTKEPPAIDVLPTFAGRTPSIAPGDPDLPFDPDVIAAERSVVKVHAVGCVGAGTGSGWVARAGVVVTNAHVVAGSTSIEVQMQGRGPMLKAVAVAFDGEHDIAVLRVGELPAVPPLVLAPEPRARTLGASIGFPLGRGAIRRARMGPTTDKLVGNLGGRPLPGVSDRITGRLVATVRGRSQPGSSGGPVVDARGRVITTVFAGAPGSFTSVTLGVPNRYARAALDNASRPVSTHECS